MPKARCTLEFRGRVEFESSDFYFSEIRLGDNALKYRDFGHINNIDNISRNEKVPRFECDTTLDLHCTSRGPAIKYTSTDLKLRTCFQKCITRQKNKKYS